MSQEDPNINTRYYSEFYKFNKRSKWIEKIWSEVFGDQYPKGLEHYGYVTNYDIQIITENLKLKPGNILLDIGCGKGGPGLRIAETLDLKLLGIDIVKEVIEQAKIFKENFNLNHEALFHQGEFYNIPLDDEVVDGIISIDAFWTVTDKIFALKEVQRVMKSGAKFIFTYWDQKANDPLPTFMESGLKFINRMETPNWKKYQLGVYNQILEHELEIIEEMGESASMLIYEARVSPPYLDQSVRRIYIFEKA